MTHPIEQETYLGDGLYASFDGWSIWLRAPRIEGDHLVALEPPVKARLDEFAAQVWAPKHAEAPPPNVTESPSR